MGFLIRVPHGFFRRHLSMVERVCVAAGLALVLYQLMVSLPAYPPPWETVVSVSVFLIMLWSPPVAYFIAVAAALVPLYSLSLYLAVLFLAVALLGQRVFIHNLGATLLVLLAPWLAQYHLEWVVILLGGLWWGKSAGAWMGGLAALWGLLLFGMTAQYPNWLDMMGFTPSAQGLLSQFKDASSLETLKAIITPLAPNPTLLLYHLLQMVLWAMAAGLLGGLAETSWIQQKHPWRAIAIVIFAAAGIVLGNLGLAVWLDQYKPADFTWIIPGLLESAVYASAAAVGLEVLRDFVEHPLPVLGRQPREQQTARQQRSEMPLFSRWIARLRAIGQPMRSVVAAPQDHLSQPGQGSPAESASTGSYEPIPVPPNLTGRDPKKKPPDDIIKIELD